MVTPLDEAGRIDKQSLKKMLDLYIDARTIPFILGTTGEAASLSADQRQSMAEAAMGITAGRSLVYTGIFDTCFENILKQAETYAGYGINIFVAHLPAYYPLTPLQIEKYFEHLADRLPGALIIYNIPATTKISIPLEIINDLSNHDNIVGLKDSERSIARIEQLTKMFSGRHDFALFSGWTNKSAFALKSGFDGIVPSTANLIPHRFYELYEAAGGGDKALAEKIQTEVDPVADFHQKDRVLSDSIVLLKLMMHIIGLCGPTVMPPLRRFTPEEEHTIRLSVQALGIHTGRKK